MPRAASSPVKKSSRKSPLMTERLAVPRIIHQIWVGPKPAPIEWMRTWQEHHPAWESILWDDEKVRSRRFQNQKHIRHYWRRGVWHGVADFVRYEVLYEYGGICPGADSICLRPLDELFLDPAFDAYAVYENERLRPGSVAPLYACTPGNVFAKLLIDGLSAKRTLAAPWRTTGNLYMQEMIAAHSHSGLMIWPSHYLLPEHVAGDRYEGPDKPYASHQWGTTRKTYHDSDRRFGDMVREMSWRLFRAWDRLAVWRRHGEPFRSPR